MNNTFIKITLFVIFLTYKCIKEYKIYQFNKIKSTNLVGKNKAIGILNTCL